MVAFVSQAKTELQMTAAREYINSGGRIDRWNTTKGSTIYQEET
jgi:hypothetical protein